ncbi:MAG: hypothetical protein GX780_03355 [Campylobacteraceae bacterium]|nr:hypothetical protein [Campylobacteraceae bacterium]
MSIVIDEAHRVLNELNLPDTDICRENRYGYLLATQDRLLLYTKIGETKTEESLRNIATTYSYKTNDAQDPYMDPTLKLETFEYHDFDDQKSYKSPKIHFSQSKLDEAQWRYLEMLGAFKHVKECKKEDVLLHDGALALEYRVLIKSLDGTIRMGDYANPHIKSKILREKRMSKHSKDHLDLPSYINPKNSDLSLDTRLTNAEKLLLNLNETVKHLIARLHDEPY